MFSFNQQPVAAETSFRGLHILHHGLPQIAAPVDASVLRGVGVPEPDEWLRGAKEESLNGIACLGLPVPEDIFLVLCGTATSTFDVAWNLVARKALPVWGAVMAVSQTQGRGQLRREWISPKGNLYGTIRLPLDCVFSETSAAVLVGALMAQSLRKLGVTVKLKWPNDLVAVDADGRWGKVGGILLEERHGELLAGIGLNILSSPPDSMLRQNSACPALNFSGLGKEKPFLPLMTGMIQLVSSMRFCYVHFLHQQQRHEQFLFAEKELAFLDVPVHVDDGGYYCGPFWIQGLETSRNGAGGLRLRDAFGQERLLLSGSIFPEKNF